MLYHQAAAFVLPFGRYEGSTIDEIATTDPGLLWLDWLRGERAREARGGLLELDEALAAYLDDPTIATELAKLTKGR